VELFLEDGGVGGAGVLTRRLEAGEHLLEIVDAGPGARAELLVPRPRPRRRSLPHRRRRSVAKERNGWGRGVLFPLGWLPSCVAQARCSEFSGCHFVGSAAAALGKAMAAAKRRRAKLGPACGFRGRESTDSSRPKTPSNTRFTGLVLSRVRIR
jgi:hypothetical protein